MIIAVDFDGTCVTHEYPKIGRDIGAGTVLRKIAHHHSLILWTMRSGKALREAVEWFEERKIPLYGVNHNPGQKSWTASPKVYANLYIDDAGLGCPLIRDGHNRPYVDWMAVWAQLEKMDVLPGRGSMESFEDLLS